MRIVSVNVSLPKIVEHKGDKVETGIFKGPVSASCEPVGLVVTSTACHKYGDMLPESTPRAQRTNWVKLPVE